MKKQNSCLQISISRERLNSFDDSSFIYDFQSFSIDFPSQIWLYIISQKKTRKCSTIVAERVLNVCGKLYTNVLNHSTRKKQHSYSPLLKLACKKKTLLTIFWLFPCLGHWSVLFPFQHFSGPFRKKLHHNIYLQLFYWTLKVAKIVYNQLLFVLFFMKMTKS